MPQVQEAPVDPRRLYRPKGPVVAEICADCPFRPDGKGIAHGHPDFGKDGTIRQSVLMGLPFYCHETVLKDPRTIRKANGDPAFHPQPHFENCKSAVLIKQGILPPTSGLGRKCKR